MADYQIGARREDAVEVGNDNAITFLGPAGPRVLSTPQMILFMERTCRNLILPMLEPGSDSLGTHVNVSHCAAAPMGSSVIFSGEIIGVNNRRVEFRVQAKLGDTLIGEGTHERTVIDVARFAEKMRNTTS
jgi:fluoroacetyl-CoA thioesterase